ncbi:TonB-dependent receptor domain-containing protein [Melioribacteraceae bacterium 4301-Me]|uniref:TonB-dependent receptor domain-containing protein n=1 Tax=Pyranulibacter aquaticus TaxID=3163344 RepID=UPI00359761ED
MRKIILAIILLVFSFSVNAQQINQKSNSVIKGRVYDFKAKVAIPYANILLYSETDGSQIRGTASDENGYFSIENVPNGQYYLEIKFIGYETKRINSISIKTNGTKLDLGELALVSSSIKLNEVVVEGDKSAISYQIDKKVIDVSKMGTSLSGTAVDILENVPSVTVDIDGNVSLRGSTNFTVYIDGRPSVLEPQDALQQIDAGSIESIEIITNPSAKYDPEGTAGIINIILKKQKDVGASVLSNLNAGLNDKLGGNVLFEYKNSLATIDLGADYRKFNFPGTSSEDNRTTINGTTYYLLTSGTSTRGFTNYGFRGNIDFKISNYDVLSFNTRYHYRDFLMSSNANHQQWSTENLGMIFNLNKSTTGRSGPGLALGTTFNHKFNSEGHEISLNLYYRFHNSDEYSLTELFSEGLINDGKRTTEKGPSNDLETKIDYTLPLDNNTKFEAGYQNEINNSRDYTDLLNYNFDTGQYEFLNQFSHINDYKTTQHSLYSIFSKQLGNLGLQLGFRTEYTYRLINVDDNNSFKIDRWDYFPGIHMSFDFSSEQKIMASYTKRIDRPHGWHLEPFVTWIDANNVRQGNPSLLPELIDSYELSYKNIFGDIVFSTDFYYRINRNKIDDIRSAYSENVTLTTFDNVGTDYSLGSEIMMNLAPVKYWTVDLMGNFYDYRINGNILGQPFERKSFNWNARLNNTLKIFDGTNLQFNFSYNSPTVFSQGKIDGYFRTDLAIKHELFNKLLSVTLQVRDLFKTAKYKNTTWSSDFYLNRQYTRESPMVMLNIKLNINNVNRNQEQNNNMDIENSTENESNP